MSTTAPPAGSLQGNYAGVASRTAAYLIDAGLIVGLYTVTVSAARFIVDVVFGKTLLSDGSLVWTIAFVVWAFFYLFYCWGAGGKTPGAALLGIRVVRRDGSRLGFRRAFRPYGRVPVLVPLLRTRVGRCRHRAGAPRPARRRRRQHGHLRLGRARGALALPRQTHGLKPTDSRLRRRERSGTRGCRCCCRDRSRCRAPTR